VVANAPNQFFAEFNFVDDVGNDLPGMKPPKDQQVGQYAFALRRWEDLPGQPKYYPALDFQNLNAYFSHPDTGDQPAEWRDLKIEVRPDGVKCWFGEKEVGTLSAETLSTPQTRVFGTPQPPIKVPTGGVGLQAFEASVSFKSVTITRLSSN
jgi:hypothetical protein